MRGRVAIRGRRASRDPHLTEPIQSPFEIANHAVRIAGGKFALPAVDPPCVKPDHWQENVSLAKAQRSPARHCGSWRGTKHREATHQSSSETSLEYPAAIEQPACHM